LLLGFQTTASIVDNCLIMSTEAETTSTVNSQPEHQAPPKAQTSKKEKKKGKKYLLSEPLLSLLNFFLHFPKAMTAFTAQLK